MPQTRSGTSTGPLAVLRCSYAVRTISYAVPGLFLPCTLCFTGWLPLVPSLLPMHCRHSPSWRSLCAVFQDGLHASHTYAMYREQSLRCSYAFPQNCALFGTALMPLLPQPPQTPPNPQNEAWGWDRRRGWIRWCAHHLHIACCCLPGLPPVPPPQQLGLRRSLQQPTRSRWSAV